MNWLPLLVIPNRKGDWIWENPASMDQYKYLEILILIIRNIVTREVKHVCMKFAMIL